MSYDISNYTRLQVEYVHQLREQAIKAGDIKPFMGVSNFMLGYYFKHGYDEAFNKYFNGLAHKLDWQGLEHKNISDKVKPKIRGWGV